MATILFEWPRGRRGRRAAVGTSSGERDVINKSVDPFRSGNCFVSDVDGAPMGAAVARPPAISAGDGGPATKKRPSCRPSVYDRQKCLRQRCRRHPTAATDIAEILREIRCHRRRCRIRSGGASLAVGRTAAHLRAAVHVARLAARGRRHPDQETTTDDRY